MSPLKPRPVWIANTIRLNRSQHPGGFLVVEGRDDRLFCERYTKATCKVVVAEGRDSVLEVIRILDGVDFAGVLGVVDPDFDLFEGREPASPNVVTCGAHDLEVALICSPAFDRVIAEFGSDEKIRTLDAGARERVLSAAAAVGYLRWMSARNRLDLKFQGLKLSSCIDRETLQIDSLELCRRVVNLSQKPELEPSELLKATDGLRNADHNLCHVCCGDDAVQVLSIGLRRAFGTNPGNDVTVSRLKRALRLAFEDADFRSSALGNSIESWESRNPGYTLLRSSD